jgi:DNA-binding Lrp family transcriptional regulator
MIEETMEDPVIEFKILDVLQEADGNVTQNRLASRIGRSVASVNFALRLLAVKGFIKVSGANRRNMRYHLTPRGILQKTRLAYHFLKRQSALYDEVRQGLLDKLKTVKQDDVKRVGVYGWGPFTEVAILYLISNGIGVNAVYVEDTDSVSFSQMNRIPLKSVEDLSGEEDLIILLERLPGHVEAEVAAPTMVCYPKEPGV